MTLFRSSFIGVFAALLLVLTACEKDSLDSAPTYTSVERAAELQLGLEKLIQEDSPRCLDFVYPVTFRGEDRASYVVRDFNDLRQLTPEKTGTKILSVRCPFDFVDLSTSATVSVAQERDFFTPLGACSGQVAAEATTPFAGCPIDGDEGGLFECFEADFPLGVSYVDGSVVSVEDWDDFYSLFEDEARQPIDFSYPLNLYRASSNQGQAVADAAELQRLLETCD